MEVTEDRAGATSEQQDNVINTVNSLDPYGPRWQLVPGNVAAGTVYAQVPTSGTGDLTFTRASTATRTNSAGNIVSVASGVPRIHYRNADGSLSSTGRLLLEPQRTNSIRNSTMVGAVAGSPGTLPTNWSVVNGGLTQTIVGVGTESGLQYIDIRFSGTATSTISQVGFEGVNNIAVVAAQSWANSVYAKRISGTYDQALLVWDEWTSGVTFNATKTQNITLSTQLARYTQVNTISTSSAFVRPILRFAITNGATYDFTIRIAAPQMELGAYATTFIPTTTAAVTRVEDIAAKSGIASLIGATEGTLFAEFNLSRLGINRTFINVQDSSYAANSIRIESNTLNQWRVRIQAASVLILLETVTSPTFTTGNFKIALAYSTATNGMAFYVNGVPLYQGTVTTLPSVCDRIILGNRLISGTYDLTLADAVNQAALFPTRLTNAQLAQLTTL